MDKRLLFLLAVVLTGFTAWCPAPDSVLRTKHTQIKALSYHSYVPSIIQSYRVYAIADLRRMLNAAKIRPQVIQDILTTLSCTQEYHVEYNPILSVIDYSLPSNQKRLWIFDLEKNRLLFHTYVSHGLRSGFALSTYFSNKYNSKTSSIGVYVTSKAYYGREGLSLQLEGIDSGFNDNATNRSIVMHGGWYMDETFIHKYGRAGRSWGCPAVPIDLAPKIIRTIQDRSLLVIYYPNTHWLAKSKFLNCHHPIHIPSLLTKEMENLPPPAIDAHEELLFANLKHSHKQAETDPIVTLSAEEYIRIFHRAPPLNRMLRRRIANMEYVALNTKEFQYLSQHAEEINHITFVIPTIVMSHGYYETQMRIVPTDKITSTTSLNHNMMQSQYNLHFVNHAPVQLRVVNQFIRWVGL